MPAKMTTGSKISQSDLYSLIARKSGQAEAIVARVMGAFQDSVLDMTYEGNDVALGIGAFKRADKGARNGTNPSNGQRIRIASSNGVRFRVGTKFKKHLN